MHAREFMGLVWEFNEMEKSIMEQIANETYDENVSATLIDGFHTKMSVHSDGDFTLGQSMYLYNRVQGLRKLIVSHSAMGEFMENVRQSIIKKQEQENAAPPSS